MDQQFLFLFTGRCRNDFQTGSIETLTAAITKLLFHLSSKKPGGGLRQKLFAGAGNVFVGFSHEDDTANSISGGYDGLDDLGWMELAVHPPQGLCHSLWH